MAAFFSSLTRRTLQRCCRHVSQRPLTITHSSRRSIVSQSSHNGTSDGSNALIRERIAHSASQKQRGVTLKQMVAYSSAMSTSTAKESNQRHVGTSSRALIQAAQFLHHELPIRLAKRIQELESLPYGLSEQSSVQTVKQWYISSYSELITCLTPETEAEEASFTALLEKIYQRHNGVIVQLALGVLQIKESFRARGDHVSHVIDSCPFLHTFLDNFLTSRVSIRILIGQHLALHEPPRDGFVGLIDLNCSPRQVAEEAIHQAVRVGERELGVCPEFIVEEANPDTRFATVPSFLQHIIFELCKNSIRATVEKHTQGGYANGFPSFPPIRVLISSDQFEVGVAVADQGGGVPRADMQSKLFSYLYSTHAPVSHQELMSRIVLAHEMDSPLDGLGVGLPLSRLYARYFGGDLQLATSPGFGLTAYVYLNRLGNVDLFLD